MATARMDPVSEVERAIRALQGRRPGQVLVVAIDGHSASGKSTLAAALAHLVDASVIHGDDFYRDMPREDRLLLTPGQGIEQLFDWERMRDEALLPLREGRPARVRPFDWSSGFGFAQPITIAPAPVILVEGVYSARVELDALVDLTVLVEAPSAERKRRRRQRDVRHGWEAQWDAAESVYFAVVRRPEHFDLVVTTVPV